MAALSMNPRSQPVSLPGPATTRAPVAQRQRSTFPRFSLLLFALALVICVPCSTWATETAEAPAKRSQPVKGDADSVIAAYLLNFVKYIEWPEAIPPPGEPWRIGVVNNERVRDAFDPLVNGLLVRGRPIVVVHADDATDLSGCQIVLLPSSGASAAAKLFVKRPVLTVYYHEKGASDVSAAIELLLQKQSMHYRLNLGLFIAQGLKPTPGLLENSLPLTTPKPARSL